mgnify:FL=1
MRLEHRTDPPLKPHLFRLFMHQVVRSEIVGFYRAGALEVVVGFLPDPARNAVELWMICRPGVAPFLPGLVRLARLTIARLTDAGTIVTATVREGHRPGARLAALLGMRKVAAAAGFETWEGKP